jgi:hypothetical protein
MTKNENSEKRSVARREYEDQHYGILIEALVGDGRSEDEVVRAVEEAQADEARAA